ncbi:MAG: EAL domain-containing protein [Rhodocyclaceae bacterium]|jgi:diguanylate cyclase (GGDEF)-like protein/PAS domain S-box-containing protein|nr:EAL domain-containing protein [Rhodocyclaceae bacterium]
MKDRTWQPLIEGMLEAVWIVDALDLRILAVNRAASELLGKPAADLVGLPVVELAATPEDVYFWEDVAAGLTDQIHSETLLLRADGTTRPVERRVSRIALSDATSIFLVGIRDQSEERRIEDELEKLIAELRATLESTADGILVTDPNGVIRGYNHRFAELWDLPQELTTQRNDAAIHGWMAQNVVDATTYAARLTLIARSPLLEATDTLVLRSGKILERVTLPQYARGRPIGRVYSFRDITRRVTDESRLQLAAQVFASSLDAIFVTDPEMTLIDVNPACERLTGLAREELTGKHVYDVLTDMVSREHFGAQVEAALQSQGYWDGEAWHRNRAGNTLPCQASLVRVLDNQGGLLHYIGFFKDLSETVNAKKRIEELAYTDALTGLPNRLLLNERIEFALGLAHREKIGFALLFLDLDRFKQINDSLGHMFGDRVLVCVAERIKDCLRQVDTAARLGGDEFLILLHKTDARGAEIIARRILNSLSQPFVLDDFSFTLTCSIGIALYPDDGETMDDLIKNADAAMYHVKERGRAGFRFYQRQMNVGLLSRMKIDHAMRQALANPTPESRFQLHYQPQIRFSDNAITGVEALLRWHDAELGDIPPAQFIQIAEESGVIVSIGNWVLDAAVAQCAAWHAKGMALTMAINVSPLQFQQADFVERVGQTLKKYALPPHLLELELTESILIQDVEDALRRLEALASLGVQLAIDDFGTGYSSLSYLKRFPIHRLKIDRSFIQDLPDVESDTAIVNAIIQLANALRLGVIAEGVETAAQQDFLIAAGCQEYQGYLCTPALPAEEFEAFAARHPKATAAK